MSREKRKPKREKRGTAGMPDIGGGAQHVTFRQSRQLARRLMRRGVFNKRIVEQPERSRGRG